MRLWQTILLGLILREGHQQVVERGERRLVFTQARKYADSVSKPLLVVGAPKIVFGGHPCGDVTIDIDPSIPTVCDVTLADVRDIPFRSEYFGAAYVSHVLEHLPTVEDARLALDELRRVADKVFIVSPHKTSLVAWLYPDHHLWVTASGDGYIIEQRHTVLPDTQSYVIALQVI